MLESDRRQRQVFSASLEPTSHTHQHNTRQHLLTMRLKYILLILVVAIFAQIPCYAQIAGYGNHADIISQWNGYPGARDTTSADGPLIDISDSRNYSTTSNGLTTAGSIKVNSSASATNVDLQGLSHAACTTILGTDTREDCNNSYNFNVTEPVFYSCTCSMSMTIGWGTVNLINRTNNNALVFSMTLPNTGFPGSPPPMGPGTVSGIIQPGTYFFNAYATAISQANGYTTESNRWFSSSSDVTFEFHLAPIGPPTAVTLPVSNLTRTTATLNGTVKPYGKVFTARFEYGVASSSTYTNSVDLTVNSATDAQSFSAPVANLSPNVQYRYHIVAQSGTTTVDGGTMTFTPSDPGPPDNTGPDDHTPKQCGAEPGMAIYDFHTELASLKITDTPVGYAPPYGIPMPFTVTYTQREVSQPTNLNFTNLGPKWNINWLTYITDDPSDVTAVSGQARPSGGKLPANYLGADSGYYQYQLAGKPGMKLRRALASSLPYEIMNADGSKDVYGQPDGSTVAPRKVFLTQTVDPAGNITTLTYDANMRITKITDALGQFITLTYGLSSDPFKITKVTDPFGRFATFDYDGTGRLIKITDVIGIQSSFTYQGSGDFINSMTTPYGTTTFTNTDSGSVHRITATDPAGDTEVLESNAGSTSAVSATDDASLVPQGMTVTNAQLDTRNSFYWDKKQWKEAPNDYSKAHVYHWLKNIDLTTMSGYLESEKSPLGSRIWYNYSDQTDPTVVSTNTTPSKIGRVIEGGTQLESQRITALGKVSSYTDPVGRVTNYVYSADGIDLLSISQVTSTGAQTLTTYGYNSQHRPLRCVDASSQTTVYTWTPTGQLATSINPQNQTTTYSYYSADTTGKQRNGHLYQIDGTLSGNSDVVTFDYDAAGNIAQTTGPDGYYLNYTYDALDRSTGVTFPDATYTEITYLALDPQTMRDRLGRKTQYVYNSLRQLTSVTDPANRTTLYNWCKCGSLSQIIDAMGRTTTWTRDLEGRATAKQYTDGSKINYTFQPLSGRLSFTTDEKGQIKTKTYNLDATLAALTYTNAEHGTPNVTFTYDPAYRRLTQMVDGTGTTTYAYVSVGAGNGAGQIASVDGPLSTDAISYTYDQLGRQTAYTINGVGETRTFDTLGRLVSVVNPLGTFGYTYVGATSRVNIVTYPNGMTNSYTYYPVAGDFRLKDIIYNLSGNTLLSRNSYEYNVAGDITRWTQISSQANLNRSWLCGYDGTDQLTSVNSQDPSSLNNLATGQYGYTYDLAGNRITETIDGVTTTASVNSLNQLTSLATSGSSTLPQQTYEWDAENRLTAINYPATNQRSEFVYDGMGRRVRVTEKNGTNVVSDLRYIWNALQIGEERDSSGATVQKRYFDRGMQTVGTGSALDARMFTRDHLGSVRGLVSNANSLTSAYDYDPWGKRQIIVGSTEESSLGFTGHWLHSASNTVMPQHRQYSAATGRWTSRDPASEAGGNNLYFYAANNPIVLNDPTGMDWMDRWEDGRSDEWIFNVAKYGGWFNDYFDPNVTLGYGDAVLFGLPSRLVDLAGVGDHYNRCSKEYGRGKIAGIAAGLVEAAKNIPTAVRGIRANNMLGALRMGKNGLWYGGRRGAWSFEQVAEWSAQVDEAGTEFMQSVGRETLNQALEPDECKCPSDQ